MRKLSKTLMTLLCGILAFSFSAYAQDENADDIANAGDQSIIGRWVQDGPAIKEYPVCYQLWKCESGKPVMGESISLPKGEWGLCDNYTDKSSNNFCAKCDAPPPIEVCE